jgi:hypothetical protein
VGLTDDLAASGVDGPVHDLVAPGGTQPIPVRVAALREGRGGGASGWAGVGMVMVRLRMIAMMMGIEG